MEKDRELICHDFQNNLIVEICETNWSELVDSRRVVKFGDENNVCMIHLLPKKEITPKKNIEQISPHNFFTIDQYVL